MFPQIPKDQYLNINSINVRYWQAGSQGTPIILLHGGGSSVAFWLYNINALAEQHRVYAFDMVGSGRSDNPSASYSLSYQAQFIREFMDALNLERTTLVGHSMGGGAALQFALMFPQQLDKLILVNSLGLGREIAFFIRLSTLPFVVQFLRPSRHLKSLTMKQNVYDLTRIPTEWLEDQLNSRYSNSLSWSRKRALAQLAQTNEPIPLKEI